MAAHQCNGMALLAQLVGQLLHICPNSAHIGEAPVGDQQYLHAFLSPAIDVFRCRSSLLHPNQNSICRLRAGGKGYMIIPCKFQKYLLIKNHLFGYNRYKS